MKTKKKINNLRVAFVVPHIFMNNDILPNVIFSPGHLALDMTAEMTRQGADVTLFTPGKTITSLPNVTADMSYFDQELSGRGDTYMDLLKKHAFTFITLARQVQSEIIAKAYEMANQGDFDIVHIFTNEEDMALQFAGFCTVPVVFTHHDPYNFMVKYKNLFPKFKHLNYISMSYAQRSSMPDDTNWVGNVYHGLDMSQWQPRFESESDYVAYLGRIVEPKGVHHAIEAVKQYNKTAVKPLKLKIAGKHYAGHSKDAYWHDVIEPEIGGMIEYVGHISDHEEKNTFLANAKALLVPSTFSEPFGMVTIESLASGTPVIGSHSGATPELIKNAVTGYIVEPDGIADAISKIDTIDRKACRADAEERFTLRRMASEHLAIYERLTNVS
jgi:glycosyltransferase involved in cell wall biosynthesis